MSQYLDLDRLRTRVGERPRTKVAQVRHAWPDIKELQAAGHSLKDIWTWLNEIGLEIGYANLSHCLGQLRRLETAAQSQNAERRSGPELVPAEPDGEAPVPEQPQRAQPEGQGRAALDVTSDPLRNLREQRTKKRGFEYDPFPTKELTR